MASIKENSCDKNSYDKNCHECLLIDERVKKWVDHFRFNPNKYERYEKLMSFVKMVSRERKSKDETLSWISESARELIREIGD